MSEQNGRHVLRGILAGAGAGLAAAWVMNVFMAGPGQKLHESLETDDELRKERQEAIKQEITGEPKIDATMKAADALVATATGGRHLSLEEQQKGGPVVHYGFGALAGAVYGGLAEVAPAVTSGIGTAFGSALFASADLVAVPAFRLSPPLSEFPAKTLVTPFAAHLVYGATTELVRRVIRKVL